MNEFELLQIVECGEDSRHQRYRRATVGQRRLEAHSDDGST